MTQTLDPFDELAAMFLTGGERETSTSAPTPHATSTAADVELLIVGHLPVRAGLWLTPYADAVARREAPVALVRLDGDEPMIQLVRGDETLVSPSTCRSLREAILTLGPEVRRWIVRPSSRVDPQTLARVDATRYTILSGADQAAIVNAYRLVKEIVSADRGDSPDADATTTPTIGLAVVGVEPATAEEAVSRLSGTTRECLGVETTLATCLPRMDASIQAGQLRSFPGQGRPSLEEVVGWIRSASRHAAASTPAAVAPVMPPTITIRRQPKPPPPASPPVVPPPPPASFAPPVPPPAPTPTPPPIPTTPSAPTAAPSPPPAASIAPSVTPPIPSRFPTPGPAPAAAPDSADDDPLEDVVRRRTIRISPIATAEVEEKTHAPRREPDDHGGPVALATYVPGLTPLAPRCPGHERVELALDATGVIHLLVREDAMRELGVVDRWVHQHHELLALACRECVLTPGAARRRHVFTDDPLNVADLHGGNAQLHLLAPVEVDGRVGWYAAALSRDVS